MAVCPTCNYKNAREHKASFGVTVIACVMCNPIVDVVVIPLSDKHNSVALVYTRAIRKRGISAECDTRAAKPKKKFELASARGAYYAIVFGEDELSRGVLQVKDLDAKQSNPQKQVELSPFATLCLLEYMLLPGGKVSDKVIPQPIIQVG